MTTPDPFEHDDAAYVLGALDEGERRTFEAHLAGCAQCRQRVAQLREVTVALAGTAESDLVTEPVPELLLPSLLRAAARRRRRTRAVIASLAGVAAACLVALVIAVWPTQSSTTGPVPRAGRTEQFVSLVAEPISATASLVGRAWGTEIDLKCVYAGSPGSQSAIPYTLYAYDRAGEAHPAGSWLQGREVSYTGGTSLRPDQITKLEITLPGGTPVLRWSLS